MKPRIAVLPLAACCGALLVAGCGSSSNSSSDTNAGAASTTATQATPAPSSGGAPAGGGSQLKFDKSSLTGKAGKVTFAMDNPSSVPHAIAVEGNGVDQKANTVQQGGVSKLTVDLKPGKYVFYCPVDGHKDAGMKGTLTIQ